MWDQDILKRVTEEQFRLNILFASKTEILQKQVKTIFYVMDIGSSKKLFSYIATNGSTNRNSQWLNPGSDELIENIINEIC